MPYSLRTCKIDSLSEKAQVMKYTIEPIVPSLYDCLRANSAASFVPCNSMRCMPSQETFDHFLKRQRMGGNDRKVRFAMFDAVHVYEPEFGRKQDLWWSQDELDEYRALDRKCSLDTAEQIYLKAYNEGFREICCTKSISMPIKLKLIAGCALGFIGLQNIVSTEWRCIRRLDVRCIVASVIALHRRLQVHSSNFTSMDVTNILATHCEQLTRSHRICSAVIGEAQKIAVEIS